MTMTDEDLVRSQAFPVTGPLELDVNVALGRVAIALDAEGEALVEIRHDPAGQEPWSQGVTSVLNWVSERFGEQWSGQWGTELRGTPAEAVEQARLELTGNRLVVRAAKALPLRNVPLAVTVHAPAGSHVEVRGGAAEVRVTGAAGRADILTSSGEVKLDRADGAATVRTGSGAVRLGPTLSGLQVRTGSGDVEAASVAGSATVATGTGDIWLGATSGKIMVRTGSGDLSVADAASGTLELLTGSGEIRIGVRPGVTAEIDLTAVGGKVSSELDVDLEPPDGEIPLHVRARTGSGTAVVTRAAQ
jgi:putative adhesin